MPRESEKWMWDGKRGGERYEKFPEVDNKEKICVRRKKREGVGSETRKYIYRGRERIPGFEIKEENMTKKESGE